MVSAFVYSSSPSLLTAVKICPTQGFASTSRAMQHLRRSATAPSQWHAVLRRSYASHASQNTQSKPSSGTACKSSTTPTNPNLERIVTEISQLNLLQAADLVTLLKVHCCSYVPMQPKSQTPLGTLEYQGCSCANGIDSHSPTYCC